jgi:RNA polymerase sigma factor (sigma-70 family)
MISCLLNKKDKKILQKMFTEKIRLQKEFLLDPAKEEAYLTQRNLIVNFVLKQLGPALRARIKTWALRKYCDEADAISLVHEHVLMAVDKYQPDRGNCSFTSFLWTLSNRAFASFMNRGKRQKRNPAIRGKSQQIGQDEGSIPIDKEFAPKSIKERFLVSLDESLSSEEKFSNLTLSDTVAESGRIDDNLSFDMLLKTINAKCTDLQKDIIALLQQNYTYKEIASQLDTTPQVISFQILKLRKKLKQELSI